MAKSLNKAVLIGNLTRDPELRYTPQGTAVCTFGVATNRSWTTDSGEKKDEVDFHKIVAWSKLAEICSQLLAKGRKVYVEGRLTTRTWAGQDGVQRSTTEIVISDMIILDNKKDQGGLDQKEEIIERQIDEDTTEAKKPKVETEKKTEPSEEDVNPDDIPF